MKRIGVILFTLLFVGVLSIVPCFADGGYQNLPVLNINYLNDHFGVSGISCNVVYGNTDYESAFVLENSPNYIRITPVSDIDVRIATIRIINNSDVDYHFVLLPLVSYNASYSSSSFDIPSGGYFDVTVSLHIGTSTNVTFAFSSITETTYNGSVFNVNGLIGTVGNVFGMIFNSSTILLPLFLIGVTLSLGFVAIRFIRKVMWSK